MAKRRKMNEELLMVPFLDILCSLIGVLVLIIVVLTVAQTQQVQGRPKEEVQRSIDYQKMRKDLEMNQSASAVAKKALEELEKVQAEDRATTERAAKLRMILSPDKSGKTPEQLNADMLKELDNLLLENAGYDRRDKELKDRLAKLEEELKRRQIPRDKLVAPVIIQPGGTSLNRDAKVFFVEASGGGLAVFWNRDERTVLSSADEVIAADVAYNDFLKRVVALPAAKIIFLIRDDGMPSYNKGAGWAQMTYGFKVDQIARLPIPGSGPIDIGLFKEHLGTLPPTPGARVDKVERGGAPATPAPPATPPAGAPPAAAPAKPANP